MAWWTWAFDGVGGAVALAATGWAVRRWRRGSPPDATQSVVATGSTVYQAGRDLHVNDQHRPISDDDVERIAEAVIRRLHEMGWRFRLVPEALREAVRQQMARLEPAEVRMLVACVAEGTPDEHASADVALTNLATRLLATSEPAWRLGERRMPASRADIAARDETP